MGFKITSFQKIEFSFVVLLVLLVLRSMITISFFAKRSVWGMSYLELYATLSTYVFFVLLLKNLRTIHFDKIFVSLFLIFCYALASVAWGSSFSQTLRFLFPYITFFSVSAVVKTKWQIKIISLVILFSFTIPIVGSSVLILMKKSLYMTIYLTGIERYTGMYLKIHTLAHCMLIFIFFVAVFYEVKIDGFKTEIWLDLALAFLTILALYNIYKTVTRTVLFGLIIFIFHYLVGKKKYVCLVIIAVGILTALLISGVVQKMLFDILEPLQGEMQVSKMGSGRIGGWQEILRIFFNKPIEIQFLGVGIGNEPGAFFGSSHNDLISLLFSLGYLGFAMHAVLYAIFVFDIFFSKVDREGKFVFLGVVISVLFMNFGSNSYLSRFELGQYLCVLLGLFYSYKNIKKETISLKK